MRKPTDLEMITRFDTLPRASLVSKRVSRLIRNSSESRDKRLKKQGSPFLPPDIPTGPGRSMHNVGHIRDICEGKVKLNKPQLTAAE